MGGERVQFTTRFNLVGTFHGFEAALVTCLPTINDIN